MARGLEELKGIINDSFIDALFGENPTVITGVGGNLNFPEELTPEEAKLIGKYCFDKGGFVTTYKQLKEGKSGYFIYTFELSMPQESS